MGGRTRSLVKAMVPVAANRQDMSTGTIDALLQDNVLSMSDWRSGLAYFLGDPYPAISLHSSVASVLSLRHVDL